MTHRRLHRKPRGSVTNTHCRKLGTKSTGRPLLVSEIDDYKIDRWPHLFGNGENLVDALEAAEHHQQDTAPVTLDEDLKTLVE